MTSSRFGSALSFSVVLLAAFQVVQADPQIPILEMKLFPATLNVGQPCPTTKTVEVRFRNNGLVNPIDVDWNSAFVAHNVNCVADYTPKLGTVNAIPAQGVKSVTITLSFIGSCDGLTTINFQGTIPGSDPADTDAKLLTVNCNSTTPVGACCPRDAADLGEVGCVDGVSQTECTDPYPNGFGSVWGGAGSVCPANGGCIPTVSEWGLLAMTLLVLSAGTVVARRRRTVVEG